MRQFKGRQHAGWQGALGLAALLGACSNDTSEPEPIIGSNHLAQEVVEVASVEHVRVDMPFRAIIYDGEPQQVRLEGEDNLLELIEVNQLEVREWEIVAPHDIRFEQHADVEIYVPYIEMVEINVSGDLIEFGDDPLAVTHE